MVNLLFRGLSVVVIAIGSLLGIVLLKLTMFLWKFEVVTLLLSVLILIFSLLSLRHYFAKSFVEKLFIPATLLLAAITTMNGAETANRFDIAIRCLVKQYPSTCYIDNIQSDEILTCERRTIPYTRLLRLVLYENNGNLIDDWIKSGIAPEQVVRLVGSNLPLPKIIDIKPYYVLLVDEDTL